MRHLTSLLILAVLATTTLGGTALAKENKHHNWKESRNWESQEDWRSDWNWDWNKDDTTVEAVNAADIQIAEPPLLEVVDLYTENIQYDKSTMTLTYDVGNKGNIAPDADEDGVADLTGQNDIYLDGEWVATQLWSNHDSTSSQYLLPDGEETRVLLLYGVEAFDQGPHTVKVCVNTTHVTDELNWDNNCTSKTIIKKGSALPDLEVTAAYIHQETDGEVTLHYNLQNEGKISVTAPYNGYTTVTLNDEVVQETQWQTENDWADWLTAGSAGVHRSLILTDVVDGANTVTVCADSQNGVTEKDEDNCSTINFKYDADDETVVTDDDEDEEDKPELTWEELLDFLSQYDEDSWLRALVAAATRA